MSYNTKWNYPTHIEFGPGKIHTLPQAAEQCGMKKPLLVTDPQLAQMPMLTEAVALLKAAKLDVVVFSDIKGNPTGKHVEAGNALFREHQCDGVIVFGGGSAIDTGKAIALSARQSCHLWDLEDKGDNYLRAETAKIAPIIAVPTTSGTGSEVGRVALIVDSDTHSKKFIFHPNIVPQIVICDPKLTVGVPAKLTAATGMDALAHNLEALCAPGFHPMADGIAMEGMRLIKAWLPVAVHEGNNIDARSNMMAAATMGATAFQKGLGAIHSLSHPVGAIYDAHHGLLNAIFMPYVLVFNQPDIEEKMQRLARFLDLSSHSFEGVLQWVQALCDDIGIPKTLAEIDIDESKTKEIAEQAMLDGSTPTNPRVCSVDDFASIFSATVRGDIASLRS